MRVDDNMDKSIQKAIDADSMLCPSQPSSAQHRSSPPPTRPSITTPLRHVLVVFLDGAAGVDGRVVRENGHGSGRASLQRYRQAYRG